MKCFSLFFTFWIPIKILSQVGINTDEPTKTLDVNGDVRVRTLNIVSSPNVLYVITTDDNGNFTKTTPLDAIYSSGLYVRSYTNNQWNNVRMGSKGTRLEFTGRANIGAGIDFTFAVFYDYGSGFTEVFAPMVDNTASITINGLSSNSFNVRIASGGINYNFNYTISAPNSSNLANIFVTNIDSIPVNGSFCSLYH